MENSTVFSPTQLLDYCILKLHKVPYNMDNETEVGVPLKEVSILLEKLKNALIAIPQETGEV